MTNLSAIINEYSKIDCRDLGSRQLENLRNALKNVDKNDIKSFDDGCNYIDLLKKFREAIAENDKLHGENYPKMLNSLLSVGEDGLYADSLRFVFELIQNVDDCEYSDLSRCELDMHFDFNNQKITLKYNEVGFSPFNVFAITGIAEAAKNVSAKKNEIGEKGIGFKSVFGVADKVIIRSGWFAFSLLKSNFTIPIKDTSDSSYCNGTEMILHISGNRTKEIYDKLKSQYCNKEALFSKNPMLFLNKLTRLKMHYDAFRSMDFHVSRNNISFVNGISKEETVTIAVDLKDYENGREVLESKEIKCARYISQANYSHEACQSRYGADTALGTDGGKKMLIQIVVPYPEDIDEVGNGGLYSFLPTQLKLSVPVVCHAPFKLDASREFVDPQNQNLWFRETCRFLSSLFDYVFQDWCKTVKADIVRYLPFENDSLFAKNNGKEECITIKPEYKGKHFLKMPIFYVGDEKYCTAEEVVVISETDYPEEVYEILNPPYRLFVPSIPIDYHKYGIAHYSNTNYRVFKKSILDERKTGIALDYLFSKTKYRISADDINTIETPISLKQVSDISKHKVLRELFVSEGISRIQSKMKPSWKIKDESNYSFDYIFNEDISKDDFPSKVQFYLNSLIKFRISVIETEEPFLFVANNMIIISKNHILESLADLCGMVDKNDAFSINIQLRKASQELDQLIEDDTISADDFLHKLHGMRKTVKTALGDSYRSYVRQIVQSGTSSNERFINELLQNADDCKFDDEVIPEFSFKKEGNVLITKSNEIGFSKDDVRAITAIGESTKKKLANQESAREAIGEKGIGFKTVFAIASEVEIHSNDFNFVLKNDSPTIPKRIEFSENTSGTVMLFKTKSNFSDSYLSKNKILELCLCLRNLRKISINNYEVSITDTQTKRIISINNETFEFDKFVYSFTISDPEAIKSREESVRVIDREQEIVCLLPSNSNSDKRKYYLYSGLPTDISINVPLFIDAPFMLRTARDRILDDNKWNVLVKEHLYKAITEMLIEYKDKLKAKVLSLIGVKAEQIGIMKHIYNVNMFSDDNLNNYPWFSELKNTPFLPTFDPDFFVAPNSDYKRYPPAVNYILRKGKTVTVPLKSILNVPVDEYETVLSALNCKKTDINEAIGLLTQHINEFIRDKQYRAILKPFLLNNTFSDESKSILRKMNLISVYSVERSSETMFIQWMPDKIFTQKGAKQSERDYYVLDENIWQKHELEKILSVKINEMDDNYKTGWYIKNLRTNMNNLSGKYLLDYIVKEFSTGNIERFDCFGEILNLKNNKCLPLVNLNGELTTNDLFVGADKANEYCSEIVFSMTVSKEYESLAKKIGCAELCDIRFDDLNLVSTEITDDDLDAFEDDTYFKHSTEIISNLVAMGYLTEQQIDERGYSIFTGSRDVVDMYEGEFPTEKVVNIDKLRNRIREMWKHPKRIMKEKVERTISVVSVNGQNKNVDTIEIKKNTMRKYRSNDNEVCYCQMCKKPKAPRFIEVNNLELAPQFYWAETRIALCLECSKYFKEVRGGKDYFEDYEGNEKFYNRFIKALKSANTDGYEPIEIPFGNSSITFTQTHLAEIQEIFKLMQNGK